MIEISPIEVSGDAGGRSGVPIPTADPHVSFFVYMLAFSAVIGGFLFGYDTGIVSSAMLFVPDNSGMKEMPSIWQEVIVAITPGMAVIGSLLSGTATDRFGRRKIIIFACVVFIVGALICAAAPEKITLLVGRILLGLAIGFASMVVPVYVSESAPAHIRGRLVTSFQLMIAVGMVMANAIAACFSYIDPVNVGWRLMFGFAAVPALLQLIAFFFLPESPRYLYEIGDEETARKVLNRIYSGHEEWTAYEMAEIAFGHEQEKKAKAEHADSGPVILRILRTPHVLKALIIGCALQSFQQLAGVNTIMYYTGSLIRSAGVKDNTTSIWISCGPAAFNCIGTLMTMLLVERLGRRLLLIVSICGVILSLCAMGTAFILIRNDSDSIIDDGYANFSEPVYCKQFTNCDSCVTDDNCGFCELKGSKTGLCLGFDHDHKSTNSKNGPCSFASFADSFEWQDTYCVTKFTDVPIIIMVIYMAFFASGYAPLPWTLNAEFYPLWARSTACSLATSCNWIFNLIISLTFLSLSQAVTKYGAFFIYAGFTMVALIFVFFMVPETKGKSIEEVEWLFMSDSQRKRVVIKAPEVRTPESLNSSDQPVKRRSTGVDLPVVSPAFRPITMVIDNDGAEPVNRGNLISSSPAEFEDRF